MASPSSNGSILAVGATKNGGSNRTKAGHFHVYEIDDSNWVQLWRDIDGEAADDLSGTTVSLSSDESILTLDAL